MKSIAFQILFIVSALLCFGNPYAKPVNLKIYNNTNHKSINDIKPKPNLYVLSIGATPPNIRYTTEDASDVYDVFSKLKTDEGLYKGIIVEQLAGKKATAANILNQFRNMIAQVSSNDVFVMFISSHGYRDQGEFRIQASDFNRLTPYSTSISLYKLIGHLDEISAQKLVFLDACESGGDNTFTEKMGIKGGIQYDINDITNASNSTIITSSSGTQNSYWHTAWKNGAFTEVLIEGLNTGAADTNRNKVITTKEIYAYLAKKVPQLCEKHNAPSPQNPYCTRCKLEHGFHFYTVNSDDTEDKVPESSPLWRTHYSAYPLTLVQNENTQKHEWKHENCPFFEGILKDGSRLKGTANFIGTNNRIDLKISIKIDGDVFDHYGKISGYTPINIELKKGKKITLHGYQYRAKYNGDTKKTEYIITCNVNAANEKRLYETKVRAISIEWLAGKEEYQCTDPNALIKQLDTIEKSKKNGIIAKSYRDNQLYGADNQLIKSK